MRPADRDRRPATLQSQTWKSGKLEANIKASLSTMSQTPALSKLERVAAEIEDAKKELDETKAKMKAAEAAGESARYLALEQREIAIRQNLAALRVKENRLESADSGKVIIHRFIPFLSVYSFVLFVFFLVQVLCSRR